MSGDGKFLNRAMMSMQLPAESFPRLPLVEVIGKCRILIENHCGVNGYCESEININSRLGMIRVTGEGLCLAKVSRESLVIVGQIQCVTFN